MVIGAGLSASCEPKSKVVNRTPLWNSFLADVICNTAKKGLDSHELFILEAAKKELNQSRVVDYPELFDKISHYLDESELVWLFREKFNFDNYDVSEAYPALEQIGQRTTVSINFDDFYERYIRSQQGESVTLIKQDDKGIDCVARRARNTIFRAHGEPHSLKIVFGKKSYNELQSSEIYQYLEALAKTHIFLFIGCSVLGDPDLLKLKDVQGSTNDMYVLCRESEADRFSDRFAVLTYPDGNENDPYEYFSGSLKNLGEALERDRNSGAYS